MTRRSLRLALTALAAALAAWSAAEYLAWRGARDHALEAISESGTAVRHPQVESYLAAESDRGRLRLKLARALLADEHDAVRRAGLSDEERAAEKPRGRRKLELAAAIAQESLASRPASWQAAMILGQARYLSLFRGGDSRLTTEPELWRDPLELARRLAPAEPEPTRLLAAAYLGSWSRLDEPSQREAEELIAEAMADPGTFALLIEPWLRRAPSLARAFEAVPERPEAWLQVREIFARQGDWERFCQAWERWDQALLSTLQARLAEVEARLDGGEKLDSRYGLRDVIVSARPIARYAPLLAAALERLPPGPVPPGEERALRGWLEWALDRCLFGVCPFDPSTLDRLAGGIGTLEPHRGAAAAIAAGDAVRADLYEQRAGSLFSEDWRRYFLLKARRLAAAGKPAEALRALEALPPEPREPPAHRRIRREVSRAAGVDSGPEQGLREWPADAWQREGAARRLETDVAGAGSGLRLAVDWADEAGAAFEVRWDGDTLGCYGASGRTRLKIHLAIEPALHLLEIAPLHGRAIAPGRVELLGGPIRSRSSSARPGSSPGSFRPG